ncbi:MAG: DUF4298 domain-containing protein [Solobacterium sp.]|nr:DUF4298 domain-containing protein [Solobacterium sp.]
MSIDRIKTMEGYLNECKASSADLAQQVGRMEGLHEPMKKLFAYYGSEDWFEDRDEEIPADVPAGVLSEDAVYTLVEEVRETAIRMLELSTDILKNRI